jgi:hypothetical protein
MPQYQIDQCDVYLIKRFENAIQGMVILCGEIMPGYGVALKDHRLNLSFFSCTIEYSGGGDGQRLSKPNAHCR